MDGFDTALLRSLFAYPAFQRQFGIQQANGTYQLTAAWQSGLTNGVLCGSIMGLLMNGILADRFRYRKTLIWALLLVGEVLAGVAWGIFQTLTTTYASEVCPTHLRAYLTTYNSLCWVIGQFIASGVLRAIVSRTDDWGYEIPFALQWMWPVSLAIGIHLAPEFPWWLVQRGRLDEAKRSLARLTSRNRELTAGTTCWDLFKGVNARRMEIGCMVWMGQTLSGSLLLVYTVVYDSTVGLICHSLVAELTSTRLRTKSVVLARNMYNIASIVANILTPRMLNPTAWGWASSGLAPPWVVRHGPSSAFRSPRVGRMVSWTLFGQGVSARKFATTAVGMIDAGVEFDSTNKDGGFTAEIERVATKT
ncbi:general alpha-glucoside permease [Trichoderma novae-zelandiae]